MLFSSPMCIHMYKLWILWYCILVKYTAKHTYPQMWDFAFSYIHMNVTGLALRRGHINFDLFYVLTRFQESCISMPSGLCSKKALNIIYLAIAKIAYNRLVVDCIMTHFLLITLSIIIFLRLLQFREMKLRLVHVESISITISWIGYFLII